MLSYAFMQNALAISFCIALLCPSIGLFLVLRRLSLIGDALSHASLAGIAAGLFFRQNPVLSAFAVTAAAGLLIEWLRASFARYTELILAVILSLSVGTALTLISTGRLHANVNSFLFGSLLTVTREDIAATAALTALSLAVLYRFFHEFLYLAYDETSARIAGVRVRRLQFLFTLLAAAAVAVSIRAVGVLVVGSLLALPAATALQFGKGFRATFFLSIAVSFLDLLLGLFLSWHLGTAPGGMTALVSALLLLVLLLARTIRRRVFCQRRA